MSLDIKGLKIERAAGDNWNVTFPDGTRFTITREQLADARDALKVIGALAAPIGGAKLFSKASDVMLGSAQAFGNALVKLSKTFGLSTVADLFGSQSEKSINALKGQRI